jgi:filamentous hemagglutinin
MLNGRGDYGDAMLRGGITGGFTGYLSGGTYFHNPIVKAKKLWKVAVNMKVSAFYHTLGNWATSTIYQKVEAKIADSVGLDPDEFNWLLMASSTVGNRAVGTRFTSSEKRFDMSRNVGFYGVNNRGVLGLPFDAVDIMLGYQGLPDASIRDYIFSGDYGYAVTGHSLGTLDESYVVENGLASKGYAYALPFGNVEPANGKLVIGLFDVVNGSLLGKVLNPTAKVYPIMPWQHALNNYIRYERQHANVP